MSELEQLIEIAREAAPIITAVYERPFHVDYKAPEDPVTEADTRANQLICQRLAQAFPGVPIVAEESPPESYSGFQSRERIFFVDPLDGTREFVAKNGEFVIMIGLVEGERPKLGVVYAPATQTGWVAEVGRGAWRLEPDGARRPITARHTTSIEDSTVLVSRSRMPGRLRSRLHRLRPGQMLARGSAGLKAAAVAEGTGDLYVAVGAAGKRWDVCAPEALVLAAGGVFTDALGKPFDYHDADVQNYSGIVAAGTQALHAAALTHLANATT